MIRNPVGAGGTRPAGAPVIGHVMPRTSGREDMSAQGLDHARDDSRR